MRCVVDVSWSRFNFSIFKIMIKLFRQSLNYMVRLQMNVSIDCFPVS